MSVGVAMVDVREMFVLVADGEVAVLRAGEHPDRVRSMVRITRIDRVRVLHGFMTVEVPVVAGCDHEHADQRHGKRDQRRRRKSVAVDGPRA